MPYRLPTFNLTCSIWTFGAYPGGVPRETGVPCQWRTITRLTSVSTGDTSDSSNYTITEMLVPKRTDIRGSQETPGNSPDTLVLNVEDGSLPFVIYDTYDVGKGFTNEYRIALVRKRQLWPVPTP